MGIYRFKHMAEHLACVTQFYEINKLRYNSSDFFRKLGHKLQTVTQDTRSTMFLLQRLSVAVQRGNAACVLGTIAGDGSLSDFFDF